MNNTSEINALLNLLDDPDEEIFQKVSEKIMHYGKQIIPNLEVYYLQVNDTITQTRIENIIHKVNYIDVTNEFEKWRKKENCSLLEGSLILSKFFSNDVNESLFKKNIQKIHQSCWLELNNYLTPLEQINIINSIFYSMYKFTGFDLEENNPAHYYLSNVLDTQKGNNYSLGILYQILCEMLDIPVYAIQLPRQFLLAYFSTQQDFYRKDNVDFKIQFYIDPLNGVIYSQNDVDVYVKKYKLETDENTFLPLSNHTILNNQINALSLVYEINNETEKSVELLKLINY